ncbi:hypothetical protein RKD37_004781 [Streptomyces ambofaciens]
MSVFWPPFRSQAALEGGGARAGVDGRVAEPLGAEQQQLVVAHQRLAVAARRGGLGGQPHHQVDDADAVRAAVGEVAEEPQPGRARAPLAGLVDEALLPEGGQQLVEVAVHVAPTTNRGPWPVACCCTTIGSGSTATWTVSPRRMTGRSR